MIKWRRFNLVIIIHREVCPLITTSKFGKKKFNAFLRCMSIEPTQWYLFTVLEKLSRFATLI